MIFLVFGPAGGKKCAAESQTSISSASIMNVSNIGYAGEKIADHFQHLDQ
jgi:hypothetical protein